jgi:8-oxo-dGTP pyrophosphatase MutT (NUDIX family)
MGFLRLSTSCAVFDDEGRVLLSLRGDLNQWNLPSGRVDAHEWLPDAAAREVREETGIEVEVERPVGLFYWQGWDRLNVLYRAKPVGGTLLQRTFETRQNQFFAVDQLPPMRDADLVFAATSEGDVMPQIQTTPAAQLQRIQWKLRRRYVENLLRGKPEPRHVRFNLQTAGIIADAKRTRLLVESRTDGDHLPRLACDGSPPWQQLEKRAGLIPTDWAWAGLWQHPKTNQLEFVFKCQTNTGNTPASNANWHWKAIKDALMGLNEQDRAYVRRTLNSERQIDSLPVWTMRD